MLLAFFGTTKVVPFQDGNSTKFYRNL